MPVEIENAVAETSVREPFVLKVDIRSLRTYANLVLRPRENQRDVSVNTASSEATLVENLESFLGFQLALHDEAKNRWNTLNASETERVSRQEFASLSHDHPVKKAFYAKRAARDEMEFWDTSNATSAWNSYLHGVLVRAGWKNSTGSFGLRLMTEVSSRVQNLI
jgi:hypothetical protein